MIENENIPQKDPAIWASQNFRWRELTVSGSHPGLAHLAAEQWTEKLRTNARFLLQTVWEPIRGIVGPVRVLSCFRTPALNSAVGGAMYSQHMTATAIDGQPMIEPVKNYEKIYKWALDHRQFFGQIIFYWGDPRKEDWEHVGFVHGSLNGKHKGEILYKPKNGGYINITPK